VLSGRDLIAGAQTGTGKTAAFVLPVLQRLTDTAHTGRTPRALVLTPTRELAAQIAENARVYGKYVNLRTAVVFGGVGINPQIDALRSGCDLLIATPGRLLDLAEQRAVDLRDIQYFVLDEADRMLDMGFIHAIRRVLKLLPARRQNLMFSATYSEEIRELTKRFLHDPVTVEVAARNATADRVDQTAYRVPKEHKRHLLAHLIEAGSWHQVLVFTRTKHGANRLAEQLQAKGIRSAAIHGNKSQGARVRALSEFKDNIVTVLVATEVAARGLDIKELPHVVNYELPNVPEDYVHRIGRTARAGGTGAAVSLVSPDEAPLLRDIERLLRRSIPFAALPEFPVTGPPESARDDRPSRHSGDRPRFNRGGGGGGRPSPRQHDSRRDGSAPRPAQSQGSDRGNAQGQRPAHSSGGNTQGQRGERSFGSTPAGQRSAQSPGNGQGQRDTRSRGAGRPHSPNGNAGNPDRSARPRRTGSY
jgi:ATP-dependent RNA helicase RhlE